MSRFKEFAQKTGKKVGIGLSPFEKLQRREKQEQDREDNYKRDLQRSKRKGDVLTQQVREERLRAEMRVQSQRGRPKPMPGRSPEGFGGDLFGFGGSRRASEDFGFGRQPRQRRAPTRRRKAKSSNRRKQPRQSQRQQRYDPFDFGI